MQRSHTHRIIGRLLAGAVTLGVAAQAQDLEVVQVRPNFYMIAGAGGNIGVQIGSDGIVLANTGNGKSSPAVLAALKKLTPLPIRYVINTDAGAEFVGGNDALSKAGMTVFTNALGNATFADAAAILAHESVLRRMSAKKGNTTEYPGTAWPSEAFFPERKAIRMNDEGIEIFHQGGGHSNADAFALFRGSDVVVAGDVMDTNRFPVIDIANGGSIAGEIAALNRLIELTIAPIPYIYKGAGTYVIPGHGRLCEQNEVVDYRDMVVIIRDTVADLVKQGKTLAQVQAARPALAYETRYGSTTGTWTTNMFIEAIYKGVGGK